MKTSTSALLMTAAICAVASSPVDEMKRCSAALTMTRRQVSDALSGRWGAAAPLQARMDSEEEALRGVEEEVVEVAPPAVSRRGRWAKEAAPLRRAARPPPRMVLRVVRPPRRRRPLLVVRARTLAKPTLYRRKRRPQTQRPNRGWTTRLQSRPDTALAYRKLRFNKEKLRGNVLGDPVFRPKKNGYKKPYYAYDGGDPQEVQPYSEEEELAQLGDEEEESMAEESVYFGTRYRPNDIPHYRHRRISQIKCEEYGNVATETIAELSKYGVVPVRVEKCSLANVKYSPANAAGMAEFPHMAGIGYNNNGHTVWGCSGALISENFVLTAAHCAHSPMGKPEWVEMGDIRLDDTERRGVGSGWEEAGVAQVVVHPLYNATTRLYDAALLRLDKRVPLTDRVRPACLATALPPTPTALATDWTPLEKLTLELGNQTQRLIEDKAAVSLRKANVDILESGACHMGGPQEVEESEAFICTGAMQSCSSQGGGPLQTRNNANKCMYDIIGVSSLQDCDRNTPTIYTRIEHLLTWIENTVWP